MFRLNTVVTLHAKFLCCTTTVYHLCKYVDQFAMNADVIHVPIWFLSCFISQHFHLHFVDYILIEPTSLMHNIISSCITNCLHVCTNLFLRSIVTQSPPVSPCHHDNSILLPIFLQIKQHCTESSFYTHSAYI